ncbi:MAG: GntR family transcriptional regulator [Anaerolineae bacterium]
MERATLIDKNSPVPYYHQLAEILRRELSERSSRGEVVQLPSENELAERYNLSRATIRHALDTLQNEGWIYRQKGKGAFAPYRRVQQELTQLISTTEDIERRGWSLQTRMVECKLVSAEAHIAEALELEPPALVYRLSRLRIVNDEPLGVQVAYIPAALCPDFDKHDHTSSLYRLLEDQYGYKLWTAREVLRARSASPSEMELLQLNRDTCMLYIERISYTVEGIPIEYLEAVWRGDRYDSTVTLSRS